MYDLVIKNARKFNGMTFDIGITKGKICEIAPLITKKARQKISLTLSNICRLVGSTIMFIVLKK